MKVLLRQNIAKLGKIGEVVEVRPGYARNYLLPQGLAYEPSESNLKAVEAAKQKYLDELARKRGELETLASAVDGKEVTIAARANEEGHLYGSIGPAQIAAALAEQNVFVEPENIPLDEPIRTLDKYEVTVRFEQDVTATVSVWVVPVHAPEDEDAEGDPEEAASDDQVADEAAPTEET